MTDQTHDVTQSTHGERVKALILATGVALMRDTLKTVSARQIARKLGLTHGAVLYHFGSAVRLQQAVAAEAVRLGDGRIIPLLITTKHAAVSGMSLADRNRWLRGC